MKNNFHNINTKMNQNGKSLLLNDKSINSFISTKCNCECHKNLLYNTSQNNNLKNINRTNITEPNNQKCYEIYTNNLNDFNMFLDALNKIKNINNKGDNKKVQKSSSFQGINANTNNILQNNKKFFKNLNLNYYDNDNENNNNIEYNYNKKICKNFSIDNKKNILFNKEENNEGYFDKIYETKRISHPFSDNYIGNKLFNYSKQKSNNLYTQNRDLSSYNSNNNNINKSNKINNIKLNLDNYKENLNICYNNNYYQKTNYIQKEKFNTNANHRISPLGHIVDNFVSMLKNKNQKRSQIVIKNCVKLQGQNYWYNKYNEDIMNKKRKLEDMCLMNNRMNNNYSCFNIKKKGNKKDNEKKKIPKKNKEQIYERNKKNSNIKEMKVKYGEKNDNITFSFKNKNNKSKTPINNMKKSNIPNLLKEKNYLNKFIKNTNENNYKELKESSFNNYIYTKKESINSQIQNNFQVKKAQKKISKNNITENNINDNKIIINKNIVEVKGNIKKKKIFSHFKNSKSLTDNLKIENFEISINETKTDKYISTVNDNSFNNKSAINHSSPSKFEKNIEIQNISNISYNPNNVLISKESLEKSNMILDKSKNNGQTVAERVRKLIMKKAALNPNKLSLSTKLNINTDLSLTDSEKTEKESSAEIYRVKKNIKLSSKSIFTIYYKYEQISILAFDYENKIFSFQDFSDFGNFEENYKLSLKNNYNGNILLNTGNYLYIITGKNYDMSYIFDSEKKIMNKLCKLNYNHSNGNLISYEHNLICLSGDFNKSVEIYNSEKNIWNIMPEMIKERSGSGVCIFNNKYILNLFGYNSPTKQYLDNLEYFDMTDKLNPSWKCLECKNFVLKIKNFFCISNNNKIIIVGGCKYNDNDKEKMKYNNNFIKIIFGEENLDKNKNIKIEELIGKIKDINKNKNYLFYNGGKHFDDINDINYEVFDDKYNCHIFKGMNNTHDIFYSNL